MTVVIMCFDYLGQELNCQDLHEVHVNPDNILMYLYRNHVSIYAKCSSMILVTLINLSLQRIKIE